MDNNKNNFITWFFKSFLSILLTGMLSACGGGGGGGSTTTTTNPSDPGTYAVSISTSGLSASGLQVSLTSLDGVELMSISSNGTSSFSNRIAEGGSYSVSVTTSPASQYCGISGSSSGFSVNSDSTVSVVCSSPVSLGGTVSGLTGELALRLNSLETLNITANGAYVFNTQLGASQDYSVYVLTQPEGQLCTVSNPGGVMGTVGISNIDVNCVNSGSGYQVKGYISGLTGKDGIVILGLNGVEQVSSHRTSSFAFASQLASGTPYNVTLNYVSPHLECSISNNTGVINSADYPFVHVACDDLGASQSIAPTVSSEYLSWNEDVVVTLNGIEDMTISSSSFNPKAFSTRLEYGQPYSITVKTPPAGMQCVLLDSVGIIEEGVIPVAKVECFPDTTISYTIGGSIIGLAGSGLELIVNNTYTMTIDASATSYLISEPLPAGIYNSVRVKTSPVGQICASVSGSFYLDMDIVDADIVCSPGVHEIGGYVEGLTSTGLTLTLNDTEVLPVTSSGTFSFTTLFNNNMYYEVEIASQPAGQTCNINNGYGPVSDGSVDNVFVKCRDDAYQVKVSTSGFSSSTFLHLSLNDISRIEVSSNTSVSSPNPVAFTKTLDDGENYDVQIIKQPADQVCTLTNPTGVINGADITNVSVHCVTDTATGPYNIGITTSGLEGTGLTVQLNGANDLNITENGYQNFPITLASTDAYTVTVTAQPGTPLQYCQVENATGTVATSSVTNIAIVCGNGVQPFYSNASSWMGYVMNDGVDKYSATNSWCWDSSDCIHGGEIRTILVPDATSCTGVSATDNLGLFDWTCVDNNGIRLVTDQLKPGKYMSDMIDFENASFKLNFVTVNNGITTDTTSPAIWWNNEVVLNNTGDTIGSGTVNIITDSVTRRYSLAEMSALIMKPGTVLTMPSTGFTAVGPSGWVIDYLWFEGHIQGNYEPDSAGIDWASGHSSVIMNTRIEGMEFAGIELNGSYLRMRDVVSSNNRNGIIIYGGSHSEFENITVNNNYSRTANVNGFAAFRTSGYYSTFNNITANGNTEAIGIELSTASSATLSNLTVNNNANGLQIDNRGFVNEPFIIDGVSASGNTGYGVSLLGVYDSSISNLEAHNNGGYGVQLELYGTTSAANNIYTTNNGSDGVFAGGSETKYKNIRTANNTGAGLSTTYIYQPMFQNVLSYNNAAAGLKLSYTANMIVQNITTANNGGRGIEYGLNSSGGARPSIFKNITSVNNAGDGFLTQEFDTQFSSMLIANNGGHGLVSGEPLSNYMQNYIYDNLIAANNSGFNIDLYSDNDYFTGLLQVGPNLDSCRVSAGNAQYPITNAGLSQGGNANNPTYVCGIAGLSDATLITGVDISTSLVGKAATDSVNLHGITGTSLFDNITDWSGFEHNYRVWGIEGAAAFADASNQGDCVSGNTCRIWDWSVATGDAGNAGQPVANNVLSLPGGNDFHSINWTITGAPNNGVTDQAYCNAEFPGSIWDGVTTCTSHYLKNATEISGDSIGNDNALCESGETCLFTPNIGAYQGHGALVSAGSFVNGTLTGITLLRYESLGR